MNKSREHSRLGFAGLALLGYAGLAYLAFLLSFAWMIAFVVGAGLPRDVDGPVRDPAGVAVAIDLALIAVFAVQHTIMARPHFKQRLARVLPPAAERATFVLASALAVMLLCWQWRPIAGVVWQIDLAPVRIAVLGLSLIAWIGAGLTTFIHDHFEFFGLRTAWDHARGLSTSSSPLREVSAYRFVRHPMMALLLVALWATPTMTLGHLVFVVGLTIYVAIGVRFEERGLRRAFGDGYADYQRRVPMLIPRLFGQPGARE